MTCLIQNPGFFDPLTIYQNLTSEERNRVHYKIWELEKMRNPTISDPNYGEHAATQDHARLAKCLARIGALRNSAFAAQLPLMKVKILGGSRNRNPNAQYFSLGERLNHDALIVKIGYANGMGIQSLAQRQEAVRYILPWKQHPLRLQSHPPGRR